MTRSCLILSLDDLWFAIDLKFMNWSAKIEFIHSTKILGKKRIKILRYPNTVLCQTKTRYSLLVFLSLCTMFLVIVQVKQNIILIFTSFIASWYGYSEVTIISNIILAQLLTNKIRPKHFAIAADNMMPVKVGCCMAWSASAASFSDPNAGFTPRLFVKTFSRSSTKMCTVTWRVAEGAVIVDLLLLKIGNREVFCLQTMPIDPWEQDQQRSHFALITVVFWFERTLNLHTDVISLLCERVSVLHQFWQGAAWLPSHRGVWAGVYASFL